MNVSCPHCNTLLNIPVHLANQEVKCSSCNQAFRTPTVTKQNIAVGVVGFICSLLACIVWVIAFACCNNYVGQETALVTGMRFCALLVWLLGVITSFIAMVSKQGVGFGLAGFLIAIPMFFHVLWVVFSVVATRR